MMRRAPRYLMLALITSLALAAPGLAEDREFTASSLKAMGGPNNPDVEIAWNRYYDSQEIGQICRRLAGTHPDLVRYGTIGKSVQGRDLHLLTITDWSAGDAAGKPAMYIDGNIHSNEIQGAEVALYTAWYVVENFDKVEWIRGLLERKTLYIVPSINPDARDYFIHEANTAHSPRSGMLPRDDDGDGEVDEDGFDDLDGDGNIVFMRKRERGGRWKEHGDDPRMMVEADPDEEGLYTMLGWEGYDNDGDGRVNEDGPGFYDPNRNWGWMWRPSHQQYGADQYPFSIPEDRAVADFVLAHPNIGGAQSYHNSGGMLLRGPGGKEDTESYKGDLPQYDFLGQLGEEMLPGYRYLVVHKDLYSVYGGELDWFRRPRNLHLQQRAVVSLRFLQTGAAGGGGLVGGAGDGISLRPNPAVRRGCRPVGKVRSSPVWRDRDRRTQEGLGADGALLHDRGHVPPQHGLHPVPRLPPAGRDGRLDERRDAVR